VHCQVKKLSDPPVLGWAFEFADEMAKGAQDTDVSVPWAPMRARG
jgi:hypothetical protein